MDKDVVLAGGVIVVGALIGSSLGMLPSPMGGSGGGHPVPLGLAPSKKATEPTTEPMVINLPSEKVTFPKIELPPVVLPEPTMVKRPISYTGGGGGGKKAVKETELMRTIRSSGKIPTVNVSSPSLTRHVSGKKTAPAPVGGGRSTTLTTAPSSPAPAPTKVTKAPSTPRSYTSPYISTPSTTKPSSKKSSTSGSIWNRITRSWSNFVSGFMSGLFGR